MDAQRTLAAADGALAASHAQLATEEIAVFLAHGGGWETAS
jgi:multidrug efflux system outer membrane protein